MPAIALKPPFPGFAWSLLPPKRFPRTPLARRSPPLPLRSQQPEVKFSQPITKPHNLRAKFCAGPARRHSSEVAAGAAPGMAHMRRASQHGRSRWHARKTARRRPATFTHPHTSRARPAVAGPALPRATPAGAARPLRAPHHSSSLGQLGPRLEHRLHFWELLGWTALCR